MDEVKIGDFTKSVVPAPSRATNKGQPTTRDVMDGEESRLTSEIEAAEAELRPMSSYEDKLKEVDVTREQAARIIDAVLMRGYYAEDVQLTRSIRARFRTRTARDIRRAQDHLEAARPVYDAHYQELLSRELLSASLESFGSDKLPHPDRRASEKEQADAHAERLSFIDALGDPALRLLMQKLVKFDRKISVVLEEGAIESF